MYIIYYKRVEQKRVEQRKRDEKRVEKKRVLKGSRPHSDDETFQKICSAVQAQFEIHSSVKSSRCTDVQKVHSRGARVQYIADKKFCAAWYTGPSYRSIPKARAGYRRHSP